MVVQHNLTAMNSNRMLGITTGSQAKSTEKLSSGYKINRAADDAAGLSISEKMRKQIRGLTQASLNAQDGISSVQTAEGALTEVHDMLQRMNELAVKAANGTNSETDRSYIQSEIDQLVIEIDRVSTTTKFNETYLLRGDSGNDAKPLQYTTAESKLGDIFTGIEFDKDGMATTSIATAQTTLSYLAEYTTTSSDVGAGSIVSETCTSTVEEDEVTQFSITIDDVTYELYAGATDKALEENSLESDDSTKYFTSKDEFLNAVKSAIGEAGSGNVKEFSVADDGTVTITAFADLNGSLDVSLHVGADSSKDNKINMNIDMMSARGLGINGIRVDGKNYDNATNAIDIITEAIQRVSTQRSNLGAIQNRLEHTVNNLDNIVENTTSAESQIRDTDMATEMVKYSNNNILAQAGQAMLAQANQANQGVLSLLG